MSTKASNQPDGLPCTSNMQCRHHNMFKVELCNGKLPLGPPVILHMIVFAGGGDLAAADAGGVRPVQHRQRGLALHLPAGLLHHGPRPLQVDALLPGSQLRVST